MNIMTDQIHQFIFNAYAIRGELVKLSGSAQQMLQHHNYPPYIANLLRQAAAVNILLATTIKFEGRISIQLQTQNKMRLLIVQTTHQLEYRGLVKFDETTDFTQISFADITKNGKMVITIEPSKGKRYQGIVSLDGTNLAECIENYFKQSEQLETKIWLFHDDKQVCGLMLQALPTMEKNFSFEHLACLAETLTNTEALSLDNEVLLHRLFHQEEVNYLENKPVKFNCGCSKKKMLESVGLLETKEIRDTIANNGGISVQCEFCSKQFSFTEVDIKSLHSLIGNTTKH